MQMTHGTEPRGIYRVGTSIPTMRRPVSSRPDFPFFGIALLLAVAAAVCALSFDAYRPAVFLTAVGLMCVHLGMPTPEPIPVRVRSSRR